MLDKNVVIIQRCNYYTSTTIDYHGYQDAGIELHYV